MADLGNTNINGDLAVKRDMTVKRKLLVGGLDVLVELANKAAVDLATATKDGLMPAADKAKLEKLFIDAIGNILLTNVELVWSENTDSARIGFENTGDASDSYLYFMTGDNGNEYFKWLHKLSDGTVEEWMRVTGTALLYKGNTVYHSGNIPFGTTAATFCQGNDIRLANARQATNTPTQLTALGVGTPAPATTGLIRATNDVVSFYSDERLKENIKLIDNPLEKLQLIDGVTYNSNALAAEFGFMDTRQQAGVLAQQVLKVQPEAIERAPFDIGMDEEGNEISKTGEEYMTVKYDRLVPLLIESVKELNAKVESQNGLIQSLVARVEALENSK